MLDFDFKFRPLRGLYIILLALLSGAVYWVSDSLLASLITLLALVDVQDNTDKDA